MTQVGWATQVGCGTQVGGTRGPNGNVWLHKTTHTTDTTQHGWLVGRWVWVGPGRTRPGACFDTICQSKSSLVRWVWSGLVWFGLDWCVVIKFGFLGLLVAFIQAGDTLVKKGQALL